MANFTLPADHPSGLGTVRDVLIPRSKDLGEMTVHRTLPQSGRRMVGPFIFFDEMGPATFAPDEGIAVRPHPHIGLSTVTYLYDGRITHRDSLGHTQDIAPGDVNLMVAGRGISHSERAPGDLKGRRKSAHGIQTWMALPTPDEEMAPSFSHQPAAGLPRLTDGGLDVRIVLGTAYGAATPQEVRTGTLYVDAQMTAGAVLPLPDEHEDRAAYIVTGGVEVAGQRYDAGRMVIFGEGPASMTAGEAGARVLLLGGDVADGPRHIWWNFVASSKEKIDAAKEAWATGDWENGMFSLPPNDRDEYIPAPEGEPATKASFVP